MPGRTRVKFCGMTSLDDALYAAALGVDAVGLIFYEPSARYVTLDTAKVIAKGLPPFITRVGVMVNNTAAQVRAILDAVPLDLLQFHGQESPDFCRSFSKPYIKVIHVGHEKLIDNYEKLYPDAIGFLFDTKVTYLPGGSGLAFNWDYIPESRTKPIILAGGLTIDNIESAIEKVKPYAVDLTSSIEKEKGIKDYQKMQAFITFISNSR